MESVVDMFIAVTRTVFHICNNILQHPPINRLLEIVGLVHIVMIKII